MKELELLMLYRNYLFALQTREEFGDKYGDTDEIIKMYEEKLEKIRKTYIYSTPKTQEENCEDEEQYHIEMDTLLTDFIKELGYNQLAEKYDEESKWFWYS